MSDLEWVKVTVDPGFGHWCHGKVGEIFIVAKDEGDRYAVDHEFGRSIMKINCELYDPLDTNTSDVDTFAVRHARCLKIALKSIGDTTVRRDHDIEMGKVVAEEIRLLYEYAMNETKGNRLSDTEDRFEKLSKLRKDVSYSVNLINSIDEIRAKEEPDKKPQSEELSKLQSDKLQFEKPPIGLRPRFIADKLRKNEIYAAIDRYGIMKKVPDEWLVELEEIINRNTKQEPSKQSEKSVKTLQNITKTELIRFIENLESDKIADIGFNRNTKEIGVKDGYAVFEADPVIEITITLKTDS